MQEPLQFAVSAEDGLQLDTDVLVLKYAQHLYGLDRAARDALVKVGRDFQLPAVGDEVVVGGLGALAARSVLFVGVQPLHHFRYAEIRDFARRALTALGDKVPDARTVAFTLHGPGYGLDEIEAFESELAGIIEAIEDGAFPPQLQQVVFVEKSARRAQRLSAALYELFPQGFFTPSPPGMLGASPQISPDALRDVGYASADKPHIFVAMPFAPEMDDIYHYGIQGAARAAGLLCERADHSAFTGDVMAWVKERIATARLVIADLSKANPNVYLEVGYAWGCEVPTVLLIDDPDELKFDVRGQRCISYSSIRDLEQALASELSALAG